MLINPVCLRTLNSPCPWSLETYLNIGGYTVWKHILKEKPSPASIIETIKLSALRGRGGAGFSTGLKWSFIKRDVPE